MPERENTFPVGFDLSVTEDMNKMKNAVTCAFVFVKVDLKVTEPKYTYYILSRQQMIECYRHDSFTESFHTRRRMLITHTAKKVRKRVVPVALQLYICRLPGVLARCARFTPG